ncbi:TerB family tellurite resistance protein [Paraglaciecola arctica]|uniref:tellurite resistance TerB family protein n=1 Tax=Paraglaciecola arctica TaxID=1128911 RepID=UPI001C070E00|nr:TerB family tellurite resistance protein [Paraglaciecola arctica]MBU3003003.1 TerB family tellurite resistance protein [Paraglaciecola arctica]
MISNIQEWFKSHINAGQSNSQHTIELATAVLLYEVMRADNDLDQLEQDNYRTQLNNLFSLTADELETLCQMSQSQADESTDFQQFTSVINDLYGLEEKRAVLDSLWSIAYADHELSPDEEYTIRKIADLLYIPHSQYIQSKLSIKP